MGNLKSNNESYIEYYEFVIWMLHRLIGMFSFMVLVKPQIRPKLTLRCLNQSSSQRMYCSVNARVFAKMH